MLSCEAFDGINRKKLLYYLLMLQSLNGSSDSTPDFALILSARALYLELGTIIAKLLQLSRRDETCS